MAAMSFSYRRAPRDLLSSKHERRSEESWHRRNPEALHQARVALRRLRSAFSLFKPILSSGEVQRLNGEMRWLAGVLGEARNIDLLLAKATAPTW